MGLFDKLFGQSKKKDVSSSQVNAPAQTPDLSKAVEILNLQKADFNTLVSEKTPKQPLSEQELTRIFSEWFAPNTHLFMNPAYFNTVNAARDEMIADQSLFCEATKWQTEQLMNLINNPQPAITNMLICGLIFQMGNFSVIKQSLYCVDFARRIPHCIALYLLLIAQKLPSDKRTMMIDAGDGVDPTPLTKALDEVKALDPTWSVKVL